MSLSAQTLGNGGSTIESTHAWLRLVASVLLGTIGSVGVWSYVVALPLVQADFAITRADASLAYTLTMVGFGAGAAIVGGLADRLGIIAPLKGAVLTLGLAYAASGLAPSFKLFALASLLIGFGSSGAFAPLIADISQWFTRRRGIAVAICSSGNYIGGAIWPPIVQHLVETAGWRQSQILIGIACLVTMLPLLEVLQRRLEPGGEDDVHAAATDARAVLASTPRCCSACSPSPAWRVVSQCQCHKCTSWLTARTLATVWRAVQSCCH